MLLQLPVEIRQHIFAFSLFSRGDTVHFHTLQQSQADPARTTAFHECAYVRDLPYIMHGHHSRQDEHVTLFEGSKKGLGPLDLLVTCRQM